MFGFLGRHSQRCHIKAHPPTHTHTHTHPPPPPDQVYPEPLRSFASDAVPAPVVTVPVVEQGRAALEAINKARRARRPVPSVLHLPRCGRHPVPVAL